MRLRLELFVSDIDASRDFYTHILGFEIESAEPHGYTQLAWGTAAIALSPVTRIPKSHPSRQSPGERVGLGHEITLVVDDIDECFERAQAAGGEIAEPLKVRPWGAKDFCLKDPDGNYIRITT